MEVSALKYSGGVGLHGRSPLLRLQSDERLVTLVRRGNASAFEALVSRYESRLLAFCRHMLGSREDAEDVLQDVMTAAYNAMLADERSINVRPWLYRIARNRSLNHMRRAQALASDTMDAHFSDHGATTADKVGAREDFRLLVGDIHGLPETQRTALVLREMDALSYEQIAEAMETTVPSVKSLLVRARVSLAEAAEARLLSCEQVRTELGEVAEGLQRRPGSLVRRHLKTCTRCRAFQVQLKATNRALAVALPVGPAALLLRKLALSHLGHSAGSGAAGGIAAGGLAASAGGGGFLSAGVGAIAGKAAAGLAAAALVTAGAVDIDPAAHHHHASTGTPTASAPATASVPSSDLTTPVAAVPEPEVVSRPAARHRPKAHATVRTAKATTTPAPPVTTTPTTPATTTAAAPATLPGRTDTTTAPTVLPASEATAPPATTTSSSTTTTPSSTTTTATTPTSTSTTTGTTTTPQPTTTTSTTPTTSTTTTPSGG